MQITRSYNSELFTLLLYIVGPKKLKKNHYLFLIVREIIKLLCYYTLLDTVGALTEGETHMPKVRDHDDLARNQLDGNLMSSWRRPCNFFYIYFKFGMWIVCAKIDLSWQASYCVTLFCLFVFIDYIFNDYDVSKLKIKKFIFFRKNPNHILVHCPHQNFIKKFLLTPLWIVIGLAVSLYRREEGKKSLFIFFFISIVNSSCFVNFTIWLRIVIVLAISRCR